MRIRRNREWTMGLWELKVTAFIDGFQRELQSSPRGRTGVHSWVVCVVAVRKSLTLSYRSQSNASEWVGNFEPPLVLKIRGSVNYFILFEQCVLFLSLHTHRDIDFSSFEHHREKHEQ